MKSAQPASSEGESNNEGSIDLADLKRKSVRGGMVTMGAQGISIAIQLTSTVVLARLLSPEDYGVMAMVMAIIGFAGLFRDLGLSSAAIQKKDLTHAQQSNLFWLNVAMGALLTVVVAAASPLVVWFYGKPELLWVTVALSFSFLIGAFGTQHGALLVRKMQFARQAVANIAGAVLGLAISIVFALRGFSYWSLVWGALFGGLAGTVLLIKLSPFSPGWFSRGSGVRDMLGFGANVTANSIVSYFYRSTDNIIIGRIWGPVELGLYSRAYSLLMLPVNAIKGPLEAVAFSSLCKLQDRPNEFRQYFRTLVRISALLSMPFCGMMLACSAPLIMIALGPQWEPVSSIFAVLALVAMLQPTASMWGIMLVSLGRSKRLVAASLINALICIAGMAAGVYWQGIGVAVGYAISYYIALPIILIFAFRNSPLSVRDFAYDILRPMVASIGASVATIELASVASTDLHAIDLLIRAGGFGLSFFALFLLMPGSKADLILIKRSASILRPKARP